MRSRSDAPMSGDSVAAPRLRGFALWVLVAFTALSFAWLVKGATSFVEGRDGSYWGDDFVYGALYLALSMQWYVSAHRSSARQRRAATAPKADREL